MPSFVSTHVCAQAAVWRLKFEAIETQLPELLCRVHERLLPRVTEEVRREVATSVTAVARAPCSEFIGATPPLTQRGVPEAAALGGATGLASSGPDAPPATQLLPQSQATMCASHHVNAQSQLDVQQTERLRGTEPLLAAPSVSLRHGVAAESQAQAPQASGRAPSAAGDLADASSPLLAPTIETAAPAIASEALAGFKRSRSHGASAESSHERPAGKGKYGADARPPSKRVDAREDSEDVDIADIGASPASAEASGSEPSHHHSMVCNVDPAHDSENVAGNRSLDPSSLQASGADSPPATASPVQAATAHNVDVLPGARGAGSGLSFAEKLAALRKQDQVPT
jgi:hypothetical protein